jgi:hypothetical protein
MCMNLDVELVLLFNFNFIIMNNYKIVIKLL